MMRGVERGGVRGKPQDLVGHEDAIEAARRGEAKAAHVAAADLQLLPRRPCIERRGLLVGSKDEASTERRLPPPPCSPTARSSVSRALRRQRWSHGHRAYNLLDDGHDTVQANVELGLAVDSRKYGIGA
uniref:GTP cyclohydrolase II domain-containing protein n=1 Tax=Oryza meridionalis TaxID=40149 RepID=A0A0E0F9K7_9ORYZ